ncbi:hypothetical protein DFH06DRAFT_1139703 [Mycena polygramma]|nr:hypothetical protein DFH06DRAFT_1139703 [Mycena polygramma]
MNVVSTTLDGLWNDYPELFTQALGQPRSPLQTHTVLAASDSNWCPALCYHSDVLSATRHCPLSPLQWHYQSRRSSHRWDTEAIKQLIVVTDATCQELLTGLESRCQQLADGVLAAAAVAPEAESIHAAYTDKLQTAWSPRLGHSAQASWAYTDIRSLMADMASLHIAKKYRQKEDSKLQASLQIWDRDRGAAFKRQISPSSHLPNAPAKRPNGTIRAYRVNRQVRHQSGTQANRAVPNPAKPQAKPPNHGSRNVAREPRPTDGDQALKNNLPAVTVVILAFNGVCGGATVRDGRWVPAESGTSLALIAHIREFHPTTVILNLTHKAHPSIDALSGQNLASFRDAICTQSKAPRWALTFAPPALHGVGSFRDALFSLYRRALAQNVLDQQIREADATQRAARQVPMGIESIPAFHAQDDSFTANLKLLHGGPRFLAKFEAILGFPACGTPAGKGCVDEPAPLATETSPGNDGDGKEPSSPHREGATDVVPPATETSTANDRDGEEVLLPDGEGAAEVVMTEEEGVPDAVMTEEEGAAEVVMTEEEGVPDAVMTEEEGAAEVVLRTNEIAQSMDIDGENLTSPNGMLRKEGSVADVAITTHTGGDSNGETPSPSTRTRSFRSRLYSQGPPLEHTAGMAGEEGSADDVPATEVPATEVAPLMDVAGDPSGSNRSDAIDGTNSPGPAASGVLDLPIGTACSNDRLTPEPLVIDRKCSKKVRFDGPYMARAVNSHESHVSVELPLSPLSSISSSGPPSPSSPIHSSPTTSDATASPSWWKFEDPPQISLTLPPDLRIDMTLFENSYNGRCEHLKMLHDNFLAEVIKNVATPSSPVYPYGDADLAASIPESSIRAESTMFESRAKILRLLTFLHHHVICAEQPCPGQVPCHKKPPTRPCYFMGRKMAATLARGFGQNLDESLRKSGYVFTSPQGAHIVHDLFRKVFEK